MSPLSILLTTEDDGFAEGVEDFLLHLANASSSTGSATSIDSSADAAVTTIDDTSGLGIDSVQWSITGDSSVDEGAAASYTLSLANTLQATETATVNLSIDNISTTASDYAAFLTSVQAAANQRADIAFDTSTGTLIFTAPADGIPMEAVSYTHLTLPTILLV